jgi:redox-sensitive bicupin YhaK (pirin superfamily)
MTDIPLISAHAAYRDDIGDLETRRPVPGPGLDRIGAFLFLNHHGPQTYPPGNQGLPFGPHPHRGFETVTFVLDGSLAHTDSAGHESIIGAGGIQWMTAGRGIVHAEISPAAFKRDGGPMEILQLWVNLPARLKMTEPRYIGASAAAIPVVERGGARLHLVSGAFGGATGPVESLTGVFASFGTLDAGAALTLDSLNRRDLFVYAVNGQLEIGGKVLARHHLGRFGAGDRLTLDSAAGATFLLCHADPIDEPVVAHGPFVMNSVEEIHAAYRDYQAGRFGVAEISTL